MTVTVADHLLQRLREWDVEQVFAYPGDGIDGIVTAFGRADDQPRFVQSRHEEMSEIGPAWDRSLSAAGPVLLDVLCDPEVPPIPPHATAEQAASVLQAVLEGDPGAARFVVVGAKTELQEFLPGRRV